MGTRNGSKSVFSWILVLITPKIIFNWQAFLANLTKKIPINSTKNIAGPLAMPNRYLRYLILYETDAWPLLSSNKNKWERFPHKIHKMAHFMTALFCLIVLLQTMKELKNIRLNSNHAQTCNVFFSELLRPFNRLVHCLQLWWTTFPLFYSRVSKSGQMAPRIGFHACACFSHIWITDTYVWNFSFSF